MDDRSTSLNKLRRLALVSAAVTYALIVMGAVVRVTGSGLGCPDWPTCYGSWIPPFERAALIEYTHRSIAAVVGVLVLWLVVRAWRGRSASPAGFRLSLGALGLLFIQAWLGRAVVLAELEPLMVTVHLGTAMLFIAVLLVIACLPQEEGRRWDRSNRLLAGAPLGVLVVILGGAWVRGLGAGLAFRDWPLMGGTIFPDLGGSTALLATFLHRLSVAALGVYLIYVVVALRGGRGSRMANILLGAYLVQVLAGALTVLTALGPVPRVSHVALGALVWAVAVVAPFRVAPSDSEAPAGAVSRQPG